jgi:trehalose 6-phosphate phosphatase
VTRGSRRAGPSAARGPTGAPHAPAFDPWPEVRRRVLALLNEPSPLLVVVDFDGTLALITSDPLATRILPAGRRALRLLARLAAERPDRIRLVVLSGRAALDVAARIRVGRLEYLGNHGLEGGRLPARTRAEKLVVSVDPSLEPFVEPAARLGSAVAQRLDNPDWLYVEVKGPSVAFHFRQAPDPREALARVDAAIAAVGSKQCAQSTMRGLERFEGRKVVEFRPGGAGGKGAALERLLERERPGSVLVLGDDRSDAEAFRVLARERARGRVTGLAVAVHGAVETPAEVVEAADLLLPSPREAAAVLNSLARAALLRVAPV